MAVHSYFYTMVATGVAANRWKLLPSSLQCRRLRFAIEYFASRQQGRKLTGSCFSPAISHLIGSRLRRKLQENQGTRRSLTKRFCLLVIAHTILQTIRVFLQYRFNILILGSHWFSPWWCVGEPWKPLRQSLPTRIQKGQTMHRLRSIESTKNREITSGTEIGKYAGKSHRNITTSLLLCLLVYDNGWNVTR